MRQRLSSRWTIYYKRILPTVWISGFAVATLALWSGAFDGPEPAPLAMKLGFLVATLVGAGFLLGLAHRLEVVWIEGGNLVVSDLSTEEVVPLADIVEVTESRFGNPKTITLRLRRPGRWGDRIRFVAPVRLQLPFSDHPVVQELRSRSSEAVLRSLAGDRLD